MSATSRRARLTTALVEVAGNYFAGWRIAVADMKQPTNMKVDGLLGQDVLRDSSAARIDYKASVVEFEK